MNGELVVGEEIAVVALDESGRLNVQRTKFDFHLAGAALAELRHQNRVQADDRTLRGWDVEPTGHPVLDEAVRRLGRPGPNVRIERAIATVAGTARRAVFGHLVETGTLTVQPGGFLRATRYTTVRRSADGVRTDLLRAEAGDPTAHERSLIAFLRSLGWLPEILRLPPTDSRLDSLTRSAADEWGPSAVRRALDFFRAPH
ncbi:GOLPH3/VPS74 family protein [Cryptosporangium minutisporangium]|uniref:GPP34 family phosphoprotein n=1 Tax=Cryptosporangium minutisporangium TaxID=113569 RepID=A0ABP6SZ48_9ACTN